MRTIIRLYFSYLKAGLLSMLVSSLVLFLYAGIATGNFSLYFGLTALFVMLAVLWIIFGDSLRSYIHPIKKRDLISNSTAIHDTKASNEQLTRKESTGQIIIYDEEESASKAKIKVVGIGGAGCIAINRMIEANIGGIEFIAINNDQQVLNSSQALVKVQIGKKLTRGLGSGGDPETGRRSALADTDNIIEALEGADLVFITAGLGGGTGTGAAPIVASLATELGALTIAVVTKPFRFEGKRRQRQAEEGFLELRECVDTIIAIPNDRLLSTVSKETAFVDSFKLADDVLRQAVQSISDIIKVPGLINVDFADLKTIMSGMGMALMGIGTGSGETRALDATHRAISSPLLQGISIEGAKALLVNITGGTDMTLFELNEVMSIIHDMADPEATIIFGAVIDESMLEEMKVTIIATGLGEARVINEHNQTAPGAPSAHNDNTLEDPDVPAFIRKKAD